MATFVLTTAMTLHGTAWTGTAPGVGNPTVAGTISASTDFSDHIKAVKFDLSAANVDFTNFGSGGYVEQKPGLISADVSIDFFNDFAASTVDAVLWPLFAARTLTFWDFKPTNSARSATNPSYVFALYIAKYPPGGFTVGSASETSVSFMIAGKHSRLTS